MFDPEKLKTYFDIFTTITTRIDGEYTLYKEIWGPCKLTETKYKSSIATRKLANVERYKERFCPPSTNINKEFYKLKNGYTDQKERYSFSVDVEKCNPEKTKNCKSDIEIQ